MMDNNSCCERSNYIDNDYICEISGEPCKCVPNGTPDEDKCFTYYTSNKRNYGGKK